MLRESIPAVIAEETLRDHGSRLGARSVYYLTLASTGDREEAEDAYIARVEDDLRNDRTPETLP